MTSRRTQVTILRADGLQVAYFAQHREALDPNLNVVDTLCPGGDHVTFRGARIHVSGYLARFLFRSEHSKLAVGQLSGGEQSRLASRASCCDPQTCWCWTSPPTIWIWTRCRCWRIRCWASTVQSCW